ncbi:hypothetical protein TRAPUB_728 [Trametes pubescens]|uniref:Uncharacterized protein n=1 Tax=Trametes pubescens TaxID=154538 RepID=A0A1M2VLA9_TRAPU|nr:hypothetical protein TRAPUB_728 [Trametes pubescens]
MAKRCLKCVPDRYSGPQEATTFRRGEVFEIQESVFTPIEHIFAAMRVSGLSGNALYRSQSSLHSIRTQERATHKHRPCILMEYMIRDAKLGVSGVYICLMGTFEKTPIENLPWIFRHFCLQVYTKNAAVVEDDHVHSIPEWPLRGDMQWIIV